MSDEAILTSFEGSDHLGVAALVNSAIRAGFSGQFHIFHRGVLPPWSSSLKEESAGGFLVDKCRLYFHFAQRERHFGFDKPFQALDVFESNPHVQSLYYMDPDVVVLSPWTFFTEWIAQGTGLVLDCNAPIVPANHPWRRHWRELATSDALTNAREPEPWYANSGFFGLRRRDSGFLKKWQAVTGQFERGGGSTLLFQLEKRWLAVTGDQDLLAATVADWPAPISFVGPDGMGFNGHFWLLSHATERPKPWRRSCLLEALKGHPPRRTVGFYLDHVNGAIQSRSSFSLLWLRFSYRVARLLGCIWRRPE